MNKRLTIFALLFIILLASALRIWNIANNPAGLFVDEASHGLEAYSLLTTGKDTHDKPWPVIFRAVGDYRDPVMIYSTIPFVKFFGMNEFAVRLTSAFYGVLAILMIYFVGKEYVNEKIGIWSALLLAISPWHVHFSRVGFQLIASVFWLLFSLYFLHKSFKNNNYYVLAVIGFILTFFSYSTTKMYIPFIILFHIFSYRKQWVKLFKSSYVWSISIAGLVLLSLLIYPAMRDASFFQRWNQVDKKMSLLQIGQAYVNHFSPNFLFITGDAQFPTQDVQRHSIHGVGELYWFQISFLLIAVSAFFASKIERMKILFFMLLLYIYPLGSIFTSIQPQATRSILGVIPFTILTAYGIEETFRLLKSLLLRKLLYLSLFVSIALSVFLFVVALRNYPLQGSDYMGWQYGYKPAMEYLQKHQQEYEGLYITHRFNMGMSLLAFYKHQFPCKNCSVMNNPIKIDINKRELFVLRPEDMVEAAKMYPNMEFQQQQVIRLPNGKEELFIGTFEQNESSF